MKDYEKNILTLLKNQFTNIVGERQFQNTSETRVFYLEKFEDNLYLPMSAGAKAAYGQGSGSEISSGKMNALRSSSALTYNLFWDQIAEITNAQNEVIGNGVYQVEFEKQYHTLKPSVSNFPANLDAFLYCKHTKEAIACEMKMAEWLLNEPGTLKPAYLNPESYIEPEAGKTFAAVAKSLIANFDDVDPTLKDARYSGTTTRYDAFQMFKHAVACYTACVKEESREIRKLTLVNCVWTIPYPDLLEPENRQRYIHEEELEHREFQQFKEAMVPVKALFAAKGISFDICFYTFSNFLRLLHKTDEELHYLRRYTFQP